MSRAKLLYIGQRRTVSGLSGYGMGDAQIDAQVAATNAIGDIKAAYNAVKAGNNLTASYIQNADMQMQHVITTYNTLYGQTSRGAAGTTTLQNFYNSYIKPELTQDLNAVNVPQSPGSFSPVDGSNVPGVVNAGTPSGGNSYPTTINISPGNSASTPANLQPSDTPGPPSGITIPGTSIDVTAPYPSVWEQYPWLIAAVAIGAVLFLGHKQR